MFQLEFAQAVGAIASSDWDRCAGDSNPFVSHAFLSTLEECQCVGNRSGWLPFPAILRAQAGGPILGVCPSYIKLNSQGEYMFDYHWADAYQQIHSEEQSYYPKLQVAVPFTPVPGPRLLVDQSLPEEKQKLARLALLRGLQEVVRLRNFSSAHITFCLEKESSQAQEDADYLGRLGEQYHWFNNNYSSFDDFLATMTSRKRKSVRKERSKAQAHPLTIHTKHGDELSDGDICAFFRMYQRTCLQKWGEPYLSLEFFRRLARKMGDKLVLFLVQKKSDSSWIAGAWNLRGRDTLFGRNWGSLEQYDLLHFEVCYYRAIDYAIEKGLSKVEAGAQGVHKIQRGYQPRAVHSAHYIDSPHFRQAIARYLSSERMQIEHRLEALSSLQPFKQY